jgi:archaeal flagellar protein FlaJ
MMKLGLMHWLGIGAGIILAGASAVLFEGNLLNFLLTISLILASLPFMLSFIFTQSKQREKEEKFLEFTRDLVEMVRSGTPVGKGIINLRKRNYGSLSPHVVKLANQLAMGITLRNSLLTFARETDSKVISRAVSLISEAERAGGKIEVILESVSASVNQVEKLRKERMAAVSNLVTQGYMIFFLFIIIMLVMEFKILPLVGDLQQVEGLTMSAEKMDSSSFSKPLFVMLLVQSFFAGLVIGKISEGTIRAGVRHSFILLTVTLLITTGSRLLFG